MSAPFQALLMRDSGAGDPFFADVKLLHKADDQANGSLIITDSSLAADNKTAGAGTGLQITTLEKKWGNGAVFVSQQQPTALTYSRPDFTCGAGDTWIFEGWCKRVASTATTASPPIMFATDGFGNEIFKLSQYTNINNVEIRFGTFDFFSQLSYTPDANGWWYWMIKLVGSTNSGQLWLGTTLVKSVASFTWIGQATFYVYGDTGTAAPAIFFYNDDTRITKADRYPLGSVALPGPFPTF